MILGPTQRQQLSNQKDPDARTLPELLKLTFIWFVCTSVVLMLCFGVSPSDLPSLFTDVLLFRRHPYGTQDMPAALAAIALTIPVLLVADFGVMHRVTSDSGARWFLLHAFGNFFVVVLGAPDMIYSFWQPLMAMSTKYCVELNTAAYFAACSDWPKAVIVALHSYHALAFRLSSEDLFHHLLFVPVIAGFSFIQQFGSAGNVLAFFISGLPGGVDYFMLGLVKMGKLRPIVEKRLNCSINTWLRAPGINVFCVLALCAWVNPPKEADPPAGWCFLPVVCLAYFNGQYYAQRVVGNYYIRKTQHLNKKGVSKVDLHAS